MRRPGVVLALALGLAAPAARAESPVYGSFELRLSGYRPAIDSEFGGAAHPYADVFGTGQGLMFQGLVTYTLYRGFGSLDVGAGAGYWDRTGHGFFLTSTGKADLGSPATDTTGFKIFPLSLVVNYRFDWLAEQLGVPLAPYVRASLLRYLWWVSKGSGATTASGATDGYAFTAGMALLLDFFDRRLALDMDHDTGINHTYLFFDVTRSYVQDFGSARSWNLSADGWILSGGLLFVF